MTSPWPPPHECPHKISDQSVQPAMCNIYIYTNVLFYYIDHIMAERAHDVIEI